MRGLLKLRRMDTALELHALSLTREDPSGALTSSGGIDGHGGGGAAEGGGENGSGASQPVTALRTRNTHAASAAKMDTAMEILSHASKRGGGRRFAPPSS